MANSYRELLESLAANRYDSYENAVVDAFNDADDEAALRLIKNDDAQSEPLLCWYADKVYLCIRSGDLKQKAFNEFAQAANIPLEFVKRNKIVYLVSCYGELNYTKYEPIGFWLPLLECLKPELYQLTTDDEMQEFSNRHEPL